MILIAAWSGLLAAQDLPARMDEAVKTLSDHNRKFMGSVLVAWGGEKILSRGYGFANLEWEIPNAPDTKFRLGSISKQFTAACILILEQQGKLKVTDPVRKYLEDAPAAWDNITIHHVLTHTAGIPSFTSLPEYRTLKLQPMTLQKLQHLSRQAARVRTRHEVELQQFGVPAAVLPGGKDFGAEIRRVPDAICAGTGGHERFRIRFERPRC
jgi:CubicO group peptidase (beta-lactamase class C family)